jgi:hypothetical protein
LYGSSLQLDDGWISCARTLLSLLLRCLDVASAPPITILNSAVDLGGGGGGGATGRYGEKAAAATVKTSSSCG